MVTAQGKEWLHYRVSWTMAHNKVGLALPYAGHRAHGKACHHRSSRWWLLFFLPWVRFGTRHWLCRVHDKKTHDKVSLPLLFFVVSSMACVAHGSMACVAHGKAYVLCIRRCVVCQAHHKLCLSRSVCPVLDGRQQSRHTHRSLPPRRRTLKHQWQSWSRPYLLRNCVHIGVMLNLHPMRFPIIVHTSSS